MPLDDLTGVIETLQQRIEKHGASLRENETRTRLALIDPLLQALGWNVADPALVMPEYAVRGGRVDYALLRPDGKPAAAVEAKRLGESLESHWIQMVSYANTSGIPYAGLTDGNQWELYEVFTEKPLEERCRLRVSIADAPAHQSALELLLLWRPNLASGRPTEANEPILAAVTEREIVHIATHTIVEQPASAPALALLPPTPVAPGWVRLTDVKPEKGKKPQGYIRLPNREEQAIVDWVDVIATIGEWLYSEQRLRHDNCTLANSNSSRAQHITHTQPSHKSGREFRHPAELGRNVFMEKSWQPTDMIKTAVKLLQHCGVNPATVLIQTAP